MKKLVKYDPSEIEKKWQKKWASAKLYKSREDPEKEKFYVLDMFPYPSGEGLHVGHPKGYIATDVISRFNRMNGRSVLHPMGFDAFGLPAENYALKTKTNPADSVKKNVKRFKKQLEILGLDYDWSREINTTDPKYYRWTQWIFLKLLEKGLAYESYEPINWCPSCKTGLANEDIEDGKCERCGTPVEKKPMRQWVLKITDYAERLLDDLDAVQGGKPLLKWPESIKELQRNWIGKSEGAMIKFKIADPAPGTSDITVFTTRPDTIFGVTYIVLAPENKIVSRLLGSISNRKEVEDYIDKAKNKPEIDRTDAKKEKTGVKLSGIEAVNPANNERIPVFIADYVLGDYGTGAVMAVPAHDERDWDFAKKYGLPMKQVIMPHRVDKKNMPIQGKRSEKRRTVHALVIDPKTKKVMCLKWKKFPWTGFIVGGVDAGEDIVSAARREVLEETGFKNLKHIKTYEFDVQGEYYAAHKDVNRVAISSAVHFELENDEKDPVSQEELAKHEPVWLDLGSINSDNFTCAELDIWLNWIANGNSAVTEDGIMVDSGDFDGKNSGSVKKEITQYVGGKWTTTYKIRDWVFSRQRYWGEPIPVIHCEKCGVAPVPERDLPLKLPRVKSYEPTGTGESPLAAITKWVNVKCPKCKGKAKRETNTMPQWAGSSWYYLRYEDPKNAKALVDREKEKYWSPVDLYVGGAEHATRHLIYARFWHKFLQDIGVVNYPEPFIGLQHVGLIMGEDGRKMSKRFGNVVNPDEVVKTFGADSLRVYEMFMGPFDQAISWNTSSIVGARRFIEKIWRLASQVGSQPKGKSVADDSPQKMKVDVLLNKAVKKVTEDIREMRFNTAISTLMITVNEIEKIGVINRSQFEILLKLLAPFAPHVADELWDILGNSKSIHISSWPQFDSSLSTEEEITIVVQVNGKIRGSFMASKGISKDELEKKARSLDSVNKWLENKAVIKVIVIPDRLVNIVTKSVDIDFTTR